VAGPIFTGEEVSTDLRPNAEQREEAVSDDHAAYPLGICAAYQVKIPDIDGLDLLEDLVLLLPVEEIGRRGVKAGDLRQSRLP